MPQVMVPPELTASASTKLATLLAVITRQAHAIGSGNETNEYMRVLGGVGQIDSFAGVIYAGMQDAEGSPASLVAAVTAAANEEEEKSEGKEAEGEGKGWMETGEGVLDEVARQTNNVVGTAGYVVESAVGMFSGVWSRVVGERGPGLG